MELLIDTREKDALTFQFTHGVSVKSECLKVGDYGARHNDGTMDKVVFERKSKPDLFSSFTGESYKLEKAKIAKAKELGIEVILAVESPALEVRKGHSYMGKDGIIHEVKKDGLSQVRQILTLSRRDDYKEIWWCTNRTEMAFLIQEYFLTYERNKNAK